MNPFQKLKLTIDRVGLQYIPSKDYPKIQGQTVYKYTTAREQQQDDAPYFKTQGPNQSTFKQKSSIFVQQQIEELKTIYQNQQKNLVQEINILNSKLESMQRVFQNQHKQNENIREQLHSQQRQNNQLRAYITEINQVNRNKLSQSGVLDKQRKLKEQIERINTTVAQLAKDLNSQRLNKKNLQRQLQTIRNQNVQSQKAHQQTNHKYEQQLQKLKQQLQKRSDLLQHSIKSSRDQKLLHKRQILQIKDKYENKIQELNKQLNKARQQIFNLKNSISQMAYGRQGLQKQLFDTQNSHRTASSKLEESNLRLEKYAQLQKSLKQTVQDYKVQVAYLKQQLQEQRSNTRVKVVQVRDQSVQMELQMYRKQCKQLLKQKTIWETVRKDKSQYTIVDSNQIILNRSN